MTQKFSAIFIAQCLIICCLLAIAGCREDPEAKYRRLTAKAKELVNQEKYEDARVTLLSAMALKPDTPRDYFDLAEIQIRLKQFPEAIENYRTAVNLDPTQREARLHYAALMVVVRQYEQAESEIRKLLDHDPADFEALILSANIERTRNNLQGAREILEQLLKSHPNHHAILANLADLAVAEGKPDEAEQLFQRALKVIPNSDTIRLALADLYSSQGRGEEAQLLMEEVLKTNEQNTTLRMYFAELLLSRGMDSRAREQFEEMLKIDPALQDTRDKLFDMYLASNNKAEAFRLIDQLRESAPNDPTLSYFEGRRLELEHKLNEALEGYLKTLTAKGSFAPAFRRAGLVELALGQVSAGHQHLTQALAINPRDIGARLALARSAFLRGELGEAQGHLAKILERYPLHLAANVMRADILLLESKTKEAKRIYQALVDAYPKNHAGYLKLGLVAEKEKNFSEAIRLYEKYLELDKQLLIPAARLARLYVQVDGFDIAVNKIKQAINNSKGSKPELMFVVASLLMSKQGAAEKEFNEARGLLTEAVSNKQDLLVGYSALAQLDAHHGQYEAAIKRYQELIKREPKHVPSLMLIGVNYERLGRYVEAADAYRKVLQVSPQFAPALNNLAWLLVEHLQGNLDEALELAQQAKQKLPNEPGVADTLGWIYHKRGQSRAALELVQEALQLEGAQQNNESSNPEMLYHLGVIQLALGEKEKGTKALKEALSQGSAIPHLQEIQDLLKSNS